MAHCLIAIGANLGDTHGVIKAAGELLADLDGVDRVNLSSLHQTAPIGGPPGQPRFLNAAATLDAVLPPDRLLLALQGIEESLGRDRRERWAARVIDLDLLLYDQVIVRQSGVEIPHPRLSFRPFVLEPAVEVAGGFRHPLLGKTLTELFNQLQSGGDFVEVCGPAGPVFQATADAIKSLRPSLEVCEGQFGSPDSGAKLRVVLREPAERTTAGPTLWAPGEWSPRRRQQELKAALDCVWPVESRD